MSEHILEQNARIINPAKNKSAEVKRHSGETVSTATLSTNTFKRLIQRLGAGMVFLIELSEEVNKVRIQSEMYSRTRW